MSTPPPPEENDHFLLRFGFIGELILLFIKGDRWWLPPLLISCVIIALILILLNSFEHIAPFVYVSF